MHSPTLKRFWRFTLIIVRHWKWVMTERVLPLVFHFYICFAIFFPGSFIYLIFLVQAGTWTHLRSAWADWEGPGTFEEGCKDWSTWCSGGLIFPEGWKFDKLYPCIEALEGCNRFCTNQLESVLSLILFYFSLGWLSSVVCVIRKLILSVFIW